MTSSCPNCGAPIEFRYDDSMVRICDSCHSAVLRTDRDVESLGKVGDLAPIDSPLKLFSEGANPDGGTFILVGMAQLKHSAGGIWQEWYAKCDGGKWGWLAEAQGRYYLTFEAAAEVSHAFEATQVGSIVTLGGAAFTVGEFGTATYVSARGEIPYRLQPTETFRFADLADGHGKFATIDFGEADGDDAPRIYLGRQVTLDQLKLTGGEDTPAAPSANIRSAKLACPECSGALELRAPDAALRVVCPYCNSLVDIDGPNLSIIAKLARKVALAIPLGSKGTFAEGEMTVIGFVERSAGIEGSWYSFQEYLLYEKAIGYRWLACSDYHWSYVQPIATGAVEQIGPKYDGVEFTLYQNAPLRVDAVYGELYWKVAIGETVSSQDYTAPPAILSVEQTQGEQNWSLSTYLTPKQVQAAFASTPLELGKPTGIAPNQVYGNKGWELPMVLGFLLIVAVGAVKCNQAKNTVALQAGFTIPSGAPAPPSTDPTAEAPGSVLFSEKFHLDGGKNIEFQLWSDINNTWMYAAIDLVNDTTGGVVSFDTNLEYYSGFEDGESWSEGSHTESQIIGPQPGGDYLIRVEAQHGAPIPQQFRVVVAQDIFRWKYFWLAFGALGIPVAFMWWRSHAFHKKQWQDSNVVFHGSDDDD